MRPQVSVYIATSLDQCIARTDGTLDWLDQAQLPGEDDGYAAFMASVDTLVIGRATYDTVLGFGEWPYTGKRVVVVTHRPFPPHSANAGTKARCPPLMESLGAEGARRVHLDGGMLIRTNATAAAYALAERRKGAPASDQNPTTQTSPPPHVVL